MPEPEYTDSELTDLIRNIAAVRTSLEKVQKGKIDPTNIQKFVALSGKLIGDLQKVREEISPIRFGRIGITLGRSDSIAKFFAFSFVNQEKQSLTDLLEQPFFGAGVYAIYYHGNLETSYLPLSHTETPIYVGKANPKNAYAETLEAQGSAIFGRLKEHVRSIGKTELNLSDFQFRYAAIQTGMQAAVEEFMIRLFRPIWNKEVKICFGIGKHGDSAKTRTNKRSPWDTMHPGREWADKTSADQMTRKLIVAKIADHFVNHPTIPDKASLYSLLSLN